MTGFTTRGAGPSFTARLTLALGLLVLAYGGFVALLGRQVAAEHEQESLQRLSHGLARHIVGHWPEITLADPGLADELVARLEQGQSLPRSGRHSGGGIGGGTRLCLALPLA